MLTPQQRLRVLIVDDDPDVIEYLKVTLESAGCEVRSAMDGDQALREAADFHPEIVFLDILIPEQDGWLVCSKLKMQPPAPAIVLITGLPEHETKRFSKFVEADDYLCKPFSDEDILSLIHELPAVG